MADCGLEALRHRRRRQRRRDAGADRALPRHHAEMGRRHRRRRLLVHAPCPPRRGGDRGRPLQDRPDHPRRERQVAHRRARRGRGAADSLARPVRDALRPDRPADAVPDPGAALHEDLRRDARAAGDGRGGAARMGGEEPARHVPRPDHGRRRAEHAHDRLSVPHPAVLPGHRRRRRADPDHGRARQGLPDQAGLHPRHRRERRDRRWSARWRTSPPRAPSGSPARRRSRRPASRTATSTT